MLRNYVGIINLDEDNKDIRVLTSRRNVATIPVGGRYRAIDFPLSNMVNAGIKHICVFSEHPTGSLFDHLSNGRPWELDRKIGGLYFINNGLTGDVFNADRGAFENNIELLGKIKEENVVIASSTMICNLDIMDIAETFEKSDSDILVVSKNTNSAHMDFINCTTMKTNGDNTVVSMARNVGKKANNKICAEVFVMKKALLCRLLFEAADEGLDVRLKDYIATCVNKYKISAYEFSGYLRPVNSVAGYYKANMDMLDMFVIGALFNKKRPIYTKTKDSHPARYLGNSRVKNSLIADGTIIKGHIENCVISRGVIVEEGAFLSGCIILQNAYIGKNSTLRNVIVDKGVLVSENSDVRCPSDNPLVLGKNKY